MKVIVTGATGMVGKGVLLECLDHPQVTQVLAIGRSSLGMSHPKLKELIHKDFLDFSTVKDQLVGFDACYMYGRKRWRIERRTVPQAHL